MGSLQEIKEINEKRDVESKELLHRSEKIFKV